MKIHLKGFINHYPDFILKMTTGKIVVPGGCQSATAEVVQNIQ
jgi:hypothetical protein